MATVIALDDYRRSRAALSLLPPEPPARPHFRADDVWGRNYTELDSVVYGLLTVRDALRYYTDFDEELESCFLEVLDAAYHLEDKGYDRLRSAVLPLKEYILDCMDEDVAKPLKTALIILDLIEKSPLYR